MNPRSVFCLLALATLLTASDAAAQRGGRGRGVPTPLSEPAPAAAPTAENKTDAVNDRRRLRMQQVTSSVMTTIAQTESRKILEAAAAPVGYSLPDSPSARLDSLNVLTTVIVDPVSGEIRFLGYYDPAFPTGPIDYGALLAEAIERPFPAFSLDSLGRDAVAERSLRETMNAEADRIKTDMDYGFQWMERTFSIFWNDPALEADRNRFSNSLEARYGITKPEIDSYRRWINNKSLPPDEPLRAYYAKIFAGAGYPAAGAAQVLTSRMSFGDADASTLTELVALLGIESAVEKYRSDVNGGVSQDLALRRLMVAIHTGTFRLINIPEHEYRSIVEAYLAGRVEESALVAKFEEHRKVILARQILHGFTLSQTLLSKMYRLPKIEAAMNTFGSPRSDRMMRIFFEADYLLKDLAVRGSSLPALGGEKSDQAFLFDERLKAGAAAGLEPEYLHGRYWFLPESVEMRAATDKSAVSFGKSRMRLKYEIKDSKGGDERGLSFQKKSLERYVERVSENYDKYARVFPPLHRLREAAKVIALARWAGESGMKLKVAASPLPALPETVEGFWGATFLVSPDLSTNTLQFWTTGGVSFDEEEGTRWSQPRIEPAVTNDVLRQLAASTAFAEKAADMAVAGDMEGAREMAEKSAEAMTGQLTGLELPAFPYPPGATPVGSAEVAEAALVAVDENRTVMATAAEEIRLAEPLKTASPEKYEAAVASARASQERAETNLWRLKGYLDEYRNAPSRANEVVVHLRNLDAAVALSKPGKPAAPPTPVADKPLPSREELVRELCSLRAELKKLTEVQRRFSRNLQTDLAEYGKWEGELEKAYQSAWGNLGNLITSEGVYHYNRYIKRALPGAAPAEAARLAKKAEDLQRLSETLGVKDLKEWSDETTPNLEWFGQAALIVAGSSPLSDELKRVITVSDVLVKSIYDLSSEYVSWQAIKRMRAQDDVTRQTIKASEERMERVVGRIRNIQGELGGAASCE